MLSGTIPYPPTSRVLSIAELVTVICHCSTDPTLASLACVNRSFKDAALPVLWYKQEGLVPLAHCFGCLVEEKLRPGQKDTPHPNPSSTIDMRGYNRKRILKMIKQSSEEEWKRVFHYAKMIRCLKRARKLTQVIDESVLYAMFSFADGLFLPNIHHLEWPLSDGQPDVSMYLSNFVTPSLKHIEMCEPFRATKVAMDSLRVCRCLKKVDIGAVTHTGALIPLRQILLQSPQLNYFTFAFSIEPSHLNILGSMNDLRELHIDLSKPYDWSRLLPATSMFPVLNKLGLQFENVRQGADFLDAVFLPCVETVRFHFKDRTFPQPTMVERFADSIATHFSKDTLRSIFISSRCPSRSPWNTNNAIQPPFLTPFLSLPNVYNFTIEANWCYDLDNEFLRTIAVAWPQLSSLTIDPSASWPPSADCRITLHSLLPFVEHCPNINSISCHIEGIAPSAYERGGPTDIDDYRQRIRTDALDTISVGDSRVTDIENAAVFISKLCPYLGMIYAWEDLWFGDDESSSHSDDWNSVQCWAKRLAVIRHQERKRVHEEYCDGDTSSESACDDDISSHSD
ncbi:hypothetical protein QCA50_015371 [Cerrena zonata]|uniref:F-box domain-containing protein n=1 Tax=Cerrena zonata TaxID=2478898 RepID=A0AAW0FNB8_9APHY